MIEAKHDRAIARIQSAEQWFRPRTVIDIGANKGTWTLGFVGRFRETVEQVLMLEASPQHAETLDAVVAELRNTTTAAAEYRIAVMSEAAGDVVGFYQAGDTGNSIFKENSQFYKGALPTKRTTTTLDAEVAGSSLGKNPIDLIKIGVQGAELLVLRGGKDTLARTTFVHFEATVSNYNPGGACYYELDEFLRSNGFFPHGIGDVMHNYNLFKTKGVGQFDILYVNPSAPGAAPYMKDNPALYCGQMNAATAAAASETAAGGTAEAILEPILQFGEDSLRKYVAGKLLRRTVSMLFTGYVLGIGTAVVSYRIRQQWRIKTL